MKITDEVVNKYKPTAIELLNELKCRLENPPEPDLEELRLMCDAAIAALPHLQTGYKVKQLEWELLSGDHYARGCDAQYNIYETDPNHWNSVVISPKNVRLATKVSLDEAKAAAQADFERRVHDCIVNGVDAHATSFEAYMHIVEFFDKDDTAGSFLNEDGEGGFLGAIARMAREIDRLREANPVDVAAVRNMVEKLIKAADEVVFHFGDNDSGFSIPSVNEADYICTSLGGYHEARAKLVSLIGDLSAAPTEEGEE